MTHKFVEFIPAKPEDGILYISIEYKTATHLCACGCGERVVTPLSPVDWKLTFNGETVSLSPSIGNWRFPCRSHYFIKNDQIQWAGSWDNEKIEACQLAEIKADQKYMRDKAEKHIESDSAKTDEKKGIVSWFTSFFK